MSIRKYYMAFYDSDQLVFIAESIKEFSRISGINYSTSKVALNNLFLGKQRVIKIGNHICSCFFYNKQTNEAKK